MVISWILLFWGLAIITGVKQRIPATGGHDPGPCNKKNHGKLTLVKNRVDDEIILICVKDKNGYKWKSSDGSKNTVGEFFNPGHDCSDILDKLQDAEDGFYWITLKGSNIYKVWCDMSTDNGGFMLVGRKNNSITWTVPSNNKPVDPYGEPHWTSSLGDAPILDFRVQMATSEDFKATKAHWLFRLKSKRPLKNLMMTTGGCDQRSAGIGNIAYVKDLQTEKIVSTKLRCSKFGFAHHQLLKFGWTMMNLCLQKPCPWGFAYYHLIKVQTDNYGAFSFSTSGKVSGMEYNATAFVGCDNGHCCGCYGPVGGTKNYCTQNCKAINGGTVKKNVYTWFWVRSRLPKRLWKKCMDYQVKRDDGKLTSYKLVGHNVVPVEGRCSKTSALLHDGIVIAPDSSTAQKVPAIDGLLEYRKDKQELFVRSNKTWNIMAKEKKVNQQVSRLESSIKKINTSFSMVKQEFYVRSNRTWNIMAKKEKVNQEINRLENLIKKINTSTLILRSYTVCNSYKWLKESSRNEKHLTVSGYFHTLKCDTSLYGWYRFGGGAGTKMPTSCVGEHRCQGDFAGWMRGPHPTLADGKVTRKVCFSHGGNCCHWTNDIEVINCGLYYVYKLGRPSKCRARYCGTSN